MILVCLMGTNKTAAASPEATEDPNCAQNEVIVPETALWPRTDGENYSTKGEFTIDLSNVSQGYFRAKRNSSSKKMKLRVTKGSVKYDYDLTANGEYQVFPIQMGNGEYKVSLYKNVSGNKYSKEAEMEFSVTLDEEYVPYLYPNQYVDYDEQSKAMTMSAQLCEGLETDVEKYEAIVDYVSENFSYDMQRARSNPGFYLGDVEGCYESKKGLCQDLAAMTACMLRVQGIPTKLVIGYADKQYHAWNSVYIVEEDGKGEYKLLDITAEVTGVGAKKYTVERWY